MRTVRRAQSCHDRDMPTLPATLRRSNSPVSLEMNSWLEAAQAGQMDGNVLQQEWSIVYETIQR